jgi:hypothetical protein
VQFRLRTMLLLFVVLWSAMAAFGLWGIAVFAIEVATAILISSITTAKQALKLCFVLFIFVILLPFLVALLLPACGAARENASHMKCIYNLKQISIALYNYHQANGCYPPAYIADNNGRPKHSWRVLILPYLDYKDLYKQYNFNEPWDGPNNTKLFALCPSLYVCPHSLGMAQGSCTSYVAVVGADAAWAGSQPRKMTEMPPSSTVMFVEIIDAGIPWTQPKDLLIDDLSTPNATPVLFCRYAYADGYFYHKSSSKTNVALVDGSVHTWPAGFLKSSIFPKAFRIGGLAAVQQSDIERFSYDPFRIHIHWANCIALAVWLGSTGLLMLTAVRSRRKGKVECGE